jgi:hypothetical protein
MDLGRLSAGERISSVSAILLFVFMFFDWFSVTGSNNSNLLFLIGSTRTESAWEALSYIPFVLLVAISATLVVSALQLTPDAQLPVRHRSADLRNQMGHHV